MERDQNRRSTWLPLARMFDLRSRGANPRRFSASVVAAAMAVMFATHGLDAQQEGEDSEAYLNRLEWRGIMAIPGDVRFSFHDKQGQGGFWIGLGEIRSGVEVVEYDPRENLVTLRHGAATRTVAMSSASVVALPPEAPSAPPPSLPTFAAQEDTPEMDEGAQERLSQLWQQAIQGSFDLQEIDFAFRNLNRQLEALQETGEAMPPDSSAWAAIEQRESELREEATRLREGALEVLQGSGLAAEEQQELREGLRTGFLSHLQASQNDSEDLAAGPADQGADQGETPESLIHEQR